MVSIQVTRAFVIDYACSSYGRGSHAQRCGTECEVEQEYKLCCIEEGFCHWYQAWWFVFTAVGVSTFIIFSLLVLFCYFCCRRR